MRWKVQCDQCETYVAKCESKMDADEIKKRHDTFRGHDATITLIRNTGEA